MSACERVKSDLVAFDRGELAAADDAVVRAHVAACPACASELRRLKRAVELVAAATAIEPLPEATARMHAALDEALAGRRTAPILDLGSRLRGAWLAARARYDESASFRRFTIASIGVHAAAAVVLAVLLARSGEPVDRPTEISVLPGTEVRLPGETAGTRTSGLPEFDPAHPDGVTSPDAPGVRFPNATTARRLAAGATRESRDAALRVAMGEDSAAARIALDRGLDWLGARRGADGSFERGVEATASAVLAFASERRSTVDDEGLGLSVAWLERNADAADVAERALALRALTAQYVADFPKLPRGVRLSRAATVDAAAARFEERVVRGGPMSASTAVAATAALADVRAAGLRDTGETVAALVRSLEPSFTPDGRISGASGEDGVALTAAFTEIASDAGARPLSATAASALEARIDVLASRSNRDASRGAAAMAVLGRPVREPLRTVLGRQAADGRWDGARRSGSDTVETAMGIVTLTRAYRR